MLTSQKKRQQNETAQPLEEDVGADVDVERGFRGVRRWLLVHGTFVWSQSLPGRPVLRTNVWRWMTLCCWNDCGKPEVLEEYAVPVARWQHITIRRP